MRNNTIKKSKFSTEHLLFYNKYDFEKSSNDIKFRGTSEIQDAITTYF